MRQILILFIAILIIGGCKKSNPADVEAPTLLGRYQTANTISVNPPIMYLQNRQITDTNIINPYLRYHNNYNYYVYNSTESVADTFLTITFYNGDSVMYKRLNSPVYKATKSINAPDELLIQNVDSIVVMPVTSLPISILAGSRCDTIWHFLIGRPLNLSHYNLFSSASGYFGYLISTPKFILQYQNGNLVLPLITYTYNANNCSAGVRNNWNIKGFGIENNLIPNDTVVMQEKSLALFLQQ